MIWIGSVTVRGLLAGSAVLGLAVAAGGQTPPGLRGAAGRFVVVLDAAHGGDDGGARLSAGDVEKTVTLALSVRLRSLLTARGVAVVTTREANTNLDEDARAQIANRAVASAGGSACLSIHAAETGSGVHVFVSSLAATGPARFLAWKTAQSAYVNRSLRLAGVVNSSFEHVTGVESGDHANESGIPATVARASLPGVDSMACPAVAIEIAPIRGADRKVVTEVTDSDYQTQIVEALAAAMLEWKTDEEPEPAAASGLSGGAAPRAGGTP